MRQARGCRRGLQRGVQRHAVAISRLFAAKSKICSPSQGLKKCLDGHLEKIARGCFEKTFLACSTLFVIQLAQERNSSGGKGTFKLAPAWKRWSHGVILLLLGTFFARNMLVTFQRLSTVGLDAVSAICLCGCWAPLTAGCIALGTLAQPAKTVEILNSWSTILTGHAKTTSVWSSPVVCMEVIAVQTGQTLFPILFPLLGLVMPTAPVFLLPALQSTGYLPPDGILQYWVWWAILYAVEIAVYFIAALPFALSAQIMLVEIGILKALANGIRCAS